MFTVSVEIGKEFSQIGRRYIQAARVIAEDIAIDLVEELERESPKGATGDLRSCWNLLPGDDYVFPRIINDAENAYFRIVGRDAGRPPPKKPIEDWVREKLRISNPSELKSVTYLVRRKIANEGTQRYRTKDNILGIDPKTRKYQANSRVLKARQNFINEMKRLDLKKIERLGRRSTKIKSSGGF